MSAEPKGRAKTPILEQRGLEALRNAKRPLYISEVKRLTGISQWHSVRTILYKLVSKGLVTAEETGRETFFSIAEPMPEVSELIARPKLEVTLKGNLTDGVLLFKYKDKELDTKPTDLTELLRKYTLESVTGAFEKELVDEGFPIKQGELLPEMKKVLKK